MDEAPGTRFARRFGNAPRPLGMHGFERLRAVRRKNADRVDDDVGAFDRPYDRIRKPQIGLHGMNLADDAHRLQMAR